MTIGELYNKVWRWAENHKSPYSPRFPKEIFFACIKNLDVAKAHYPAIPLSFWEKCRQQITSDELDDIETPVIEIDWNEVFKA